MRSLFLSLLLSSGLLCLVAAPAHATPLVLKPVTGYVFYEKCDKLGCGFDVATTLTIPNLNFTSGTTIQSSQVNANFSAINSWANGGVDYVNIGSGGIKPVQVKCASQADCTFGSAQTYYFNSGNASTTSLVVSSAASPSVNIFAVQQHGSGAIHVSSSGALVFDPLASCTVNGSVDICNDNGGTNGLFVNVPTGSTNGIQFGVNGTAYLVVDKNGVTNVGGLTAGTTNAGDLEVARSSTTGLIAIGGSGSNCATDWNITVSGFQTTGCASLIKLSGASAAGALPLFFNASALQNVNAHFESGTFSTTVANGTPCGAQSGCTLTANTVTFTLSYTAANDYACVAVDNGSVGAIIPVWKVTSKAAGSMTLGLFQAGSTTYAANNSVVAGWLCYGF